MASGTINFNTNDGRLNGKIEWSSSSNGSSSNTSNVTAALYVRRTDSYSTTGTWRGSLNIGGEEKGFSLHLSISSNWTKMIEFTKYNVSHNDDGSGTCWISGYCNGPSGTTMSGVTVSGSQTVTLDKIARYLSITGFSIQTRQINKVVVKWSVSDARDRTQYSLNGAAWQDATNLNVASDNKSGTFEVLNLNPNTTYNLRISCKRADSQLWTESSEITFTTYDYAKLTSAPNVNIGSSQKITWTNPNNASTSLKLCKTDNSQIISYGTVTGTSKTVTPTASTIYALTPNSNSYKARYIITTTQNGKTYTHSKDFTFNVTNSNPTFTNFDYEDLSGVTRELTGNNKILIKKYSNLSVKVSSANKAVAKNSATMKTYKLTVGSRTENKNYSSNSDVTFSAFGPESGTIIVYATDSRGNSTSVSKTATFKNYSEPIIKIFEAIRSNNGVGSEVTLKFSGTFWNQNFGAVQNTIVGISYNYKETSSSNFIAGTTKITFTISNDKFSGEIKIQGDLGANGFDVSKTFNIRLNVVDKLGTSHQTITLGAGTPAIAIYKDKVAIGGKYNTSTNETLQVNGNAKATTFIGNLQGTADKIKIRSRNTSDTWIPVIKDGYFDYTTRYKPTAKTHSQFNTKQDRLATLSMLSYWNGAYDSSNKSNLTYSSEGTIQAKPKVLYNNSTGTTGTVTLSESAANFTLLKILYSDDWSQYKSDDVYSPNNKTVQLLSCRIIENNSTFMRFRLVKISGTQITNSDTGNWTSWNNDTNNTTSNIFIHQVLGYK